jgi:ATP-dependent helicase/nuclease subunit A
MAREKKFVFVDEYQDINAAQDQNHRRARVGRHSGQPLSRRRREAEHLPLPPGGPENLPRLRPHLARGENGRMIPLAENFRSREGLLDFVNSVFSLILREEIGGVGYDADAQLKFGAPEKRAELGVAKNPSPRVELLLRRKPRAGEVAEDGNSDLADLDETTKEARLLARHLKQLAAGAHEIWDDEKKALRPRVSATWRCCCVRRAARRKFTRRNSSARACRWPWRAADFLKAAEILDLLSLLQLLDNPLQDVPCIAVLRSPLVGLSLDELAEIRLAAPGRHFWTALVRWRETHGQAENGNLFAKADRFLDPLCALAETGETGFALGLPGDGADGDALRGLAAGAAARRAAGREH